MGKTIQDNELSKPRALNTQNNKELNKTQLNNIISNYRDKLAEQRGEKTKPRKTRKFKLKVLGNRN